MFWHPESLDNPVLAWEMKQASRRQRWRWFQVGYCVWLLLQGLALLGVVNSSTRMLPGDPRILPGDAYIRRQLYQQIYAHQMEFLDNYLGLLLLFQLILIMAIVPAITASSLGQEKERGTLFALFGSALTSRQILVGKLLGRLIILVPLALSTLPALVFVATVTGQGFMPLVLAFVQQAVVAFAVGTASLLFGIWIRRATDATVAAYICLGLAYVIIRGFISFLPAMFWLDPVESLGTVLRAGSRLLFAAHLVTWAILGILFLRLGWGRLRKVCVEQREKKPSRRLWAFRPAVGNNAIRWRECYVIGLAPMPILRIVPRWLALLGFFAFSAAVGGMMATNIAPGFIATLLKLDLISAFQQVRWRGSVTTELVPHMGLVFILSATLLVGVRCGTSVAEEKRRNTWDDLLLTAQSFREITQGKMWGVLQATVPYVIAYALPVFILAAAGGLRALVSAAFWILLPCAVVYVAALRGIDMLRVPPDMDETREGGAFWFEKGRAKRRVYLPVKLREPR
jgi:ABC-type transport system involved in multi-copper enzyme maturation permease subunit